VECFTKACGHNEQAKSVMLQGYFNQGDVPLSDTYPTFRHSET